VTKDNTRANKASNKRFFCGMSAAALLAAAIVVAVLVGSE
jgi:hypothetical protein